MNTYEQDDREFREQIWSLIELIVHSDLDALQLAQLKTHSELKSLAERADIDPSGTKEQLAERLFAELKELAETTQKWSLQLNMIADGRLDVDSFAQLNSTDELGNISYFLGIEPSETKKEMAQAIFDCVHENHSTEGEANHDRAEETDGGELLGNILTGVAALGAGVLIGHLAEQEAATQREQEGIEAFIDGAMSVLSGGFDDL